MCCQFGSNKLLGFDIPHIGRGGGLRKGKWAGSPSNIRGIHNEARSENPSPEEAWLSDRESSFLSRIPPGAGVTGAFSEGPGHGHLPREESTQEAFPVPPVGVRVCLFIRDLPEGRFVPFWFLCRQ